MCYRIIIFEMLNANEVNYETSESVRSPQQDHINTTGWNETAIIMVGGVAKLFTNSFEALTSGGHFPEMWSQLLKSLKAFLDRGVLDLNTAVYAAMKNMLAGIETTENVGKSSIILIWNIWKDSNPVLHLDTSKEREGNQECLVAYLDWLHQIYRFMGRGMLLEQVRDVANHLHSLVIGSEVTVYSADLDSLTKVQNYVLESLKKMPADAPDSFPEIVKSLAGFVRLAYENEGTKKRQTYVALSKSSMDLLRSCIIGYLRAGQIPNPDLLTRGIAALELPIKIKYKWRLEGKEPKTWRKATTTALAILEACIPPGLASLQDNAAFWDVVINISDGILAADCESCNTQSDIPLDQEFDIDAYSRLRKLLILGIGSSNTPDSIRRKYVQSLFNHSIIHAPHPDDLARPGEELLQGLQSIHIGRTKDLPRYPRFKLGYVLLDELFSLVSVQDGSPRRLKLAQAAAPFLILRAGITLKAYVYDQPLRGRMPQPRSQKQEFLLILQKLHELDSEPRAFPDLSGFTSKHKKHLHILYPLVVKATEAAWRDEGVTEALRKILTAVGQDFGVRTDMPDQIKGINSFKD